MSRVLVIAVVLWAGCRTELLAESTLPASDAAVAVDLAQALGCIASNYLTHDSFDVVAAALTKCFDANVGCGRPDSSHLTMSLLPEGVGDVSFQQIVLPDGTSDIIGLGHPDVTPAPAHGILSAGHVLVGITLETALRQLYAIDGAMFFVCTWK